MVWTKSEPRSQAEWSGILENLREVLESVLMGIDLGQKEGLRSDILSLDALDELNQFMESLKKDLGL